jgi:hypothetical protein
MGMFEERHIIQAGVWGVPFSFIVAYLPFLPMQVKAVVWGALVGFPCMVILSGMLDRLLQRRRFTQEAKVYHNEGERGK